MSTTLSDGTKLSGTNRNADLYRQLRTAKQIRASHKMRRLQQLTAMFERERKKPRVQDSSSANFGFSRLLDVLGRLMPGGGE